MIRVLLAALFGVGVNAPAQRPAQGPISQQRFVPAEHGYKLVWEDHFDGAALDTNKWEVRGIGPRALGFVSPEAVKVEGGYLKLSALKKRMMGRKLAKRHKSDSVEA